MSGDMSDDEFCETNFAEPSPIKKRSNLLPKPSEWNEKLKKHEELKVKVEQTDIQLLTFLINKKESNFCENIAELVAIPGTILFAPEGKSYFSNENVRLEISVWFKDSPSFCKLTLNEFKWHLKLGHIIPLNKLDEEERKLLRLFCFNLLRYEEDILVARLILRLLSADTIPFTDINLKEWGGSHFSSLFQLLESSVPSYKSEECRQLFRESCFAALDRKTYCCTHVFPSFLSACLQQSSNKFPITEEVNWLLELNLKPEECTHLLKVLPQTESFKEVGLQFAIKSFKIFIQSSTIDEECSNLSDLVHFIQRNESKICDLPINTIFHLLNILIYIVLRIPVDDESKVTNSLEELLCSIEVLKQRYQKIRNEVNFVLIDVINRVHLTIQQRIPIQFRKIPPDIQYRQKLLTSHLEQTASDK